MAKGPQIDGIISARSGDQIQITTADGNRTAVAVGDMTKIRAKGGFLGLDRDKLAADSLMNGLPVSVETLQWDGGLLASQIDRKSTRLNSITTANLVCRLLLDTKKHK